MGLVVVTGISGAGKTTVIEVALERMKKKYELINFGTEMFEAEKKMGLVKKRDDLRYLNPRQQKSFQEMVAGKINSLSLEKDIIIDTHCFIKTPKGYLPGLPSWVLEKLQPEKIIIVESSSREIKERRARDATRKRDIESEEELEFQKELNRMMASAYSMMSGATISFVYNHDGKLKEAASRMRNILE